LAINRGQDADIVGTVAGQRAGMKYRYSSIPERWLEVLKLYDNILDATDCLQEFGSSPTISLNYFEPSTSSLCI
jgi:ADP-ribosylglycohydrolase